MQLLELEQLYKDCRNLKHYHYKDLPDLDFLGKAKASFKRLTTSHQEKVIMSWANKLGKKVNELSKDDIEQLVKYRFLAQTNLYFLCHLLEKYNQTTLNTHEDICNEFFVQKDPTYTTFEKFANQYTDLKQRMLLVPRGGFKSSIDMADCVQWIVCFPDITILILTGTLKLAKDFVGEIKDHFTYEMKKEADEKGKPVYGPRLLMNRESGDWSESLFQVLFPEHCSAPGEGVQDEFQTPAGGIEKEPTIRSASIEQALSGMHFGVLKLDDVVTNENSQTADRIEKVNKQISINKAMLNPYGFFDVIGTWYDEQDFYGMTIAQEEKFAVEEGLLENIKGTVDSGIFNSSVFFKVYLRACWWPVDAAIKAGKIEEEMTKDDYILWFPERLDFNFLNLQRKTENPPGTFAIKYLNNPRKINKVKFPRELLVRRTIPHTYMPPSTSGIIVTTVDTAYSTKQWADYTVIITAVIFGGRFYIINMTRGRYNEYDLPKIIAQVGYKWKPRRIAIEESVGVRWLTKELKREMDNLKVSIPIEFCSLGYGSKLRSKQMKAKPVLRLLGDERLYFLNSCEGLEEIYNELEKFTGTKEDQHDDIVSAISLLVEQFGGYADMDAKVNSVNQDYIANKQAAELHNKIYCLGKYAKYGQQDDNPVTQYQINTAIYTNLQPNDLYIDPLADLV
jgi:phage terminase large subunit-like protein